MPMTVIIPYPRFGIDRFADRAKDAQGTEIIFGRPLVAEANQGADGRGRGVEGIDPNFLNDFFQKRPSASGKVGTPSNMRVVPPLQSGP